MITPKELDIVRGFLWGWSFPNFERVLACWFSPGGFGRHPVAQLNKSLPPLSRALEERYSRSTTELLKLRRKPQLSPTTCRAAAHESNASEAIRSFVGRSILLRSAHELPWFEDIFFWGGDTAMFPLSFFLHSQFQGGVFSFQTTPRLLPGSGKSTPRLLGCEALANQETTSDASNFGGHPLMDKTLHNFETVVETMVCWYLQGFLRCEMDFAVQLA